MNGGGRSTPTVGASGGPATAASQECGVDVFLVGSELVSTERQENRWRELIGKIRRQSTSIIDRQFREHLKKQNPDWKPEQFHTELGIDNIGTFAASALGAESMKANLAVLYESFAAERRMMLSYSANWDHYTVPKFWDDLDIVGMTTYYNLNRSRRSDPSVADLVEAWEPVREEIARWRQTVNRPIFFTEVGWASQDGCSIEPWNYYRSKQMDLVEQQRCMQSFLQTFAGEPWVGGILIWKWRDHPGMTGTLDENDYSRLNYTPFGKPVMKDLQAFFAAANDGIQTTPQPADETVRPPVDLEITVQSAE